jgi:hypothetical protein
VPVTAKLSRKFYEKLGDEVTGELVDWFNAVDATYKAELKETNDLNWERFRAVLLAETASVKSELRGEFRTGLADLRSDLLKWMFIYWSGTVAAIIAASYFSPK